MPFSLGVIAGSLLTRPLVGRLSTHRWEASASAASRSAISSSRSPTAPAPESSPASRSPALVWIAAVAATSIGTDVSDALTSSATGLLNTGGQLGTALGVAALVTLASIVDFRRRSGNGDGLGGRGRDRGLCAVYPQPARATGTIGADVRRADRR